MTELTGSQTLEKHIKAHKLNRLLKRDFILFLLLLNLLPGCCSTNHIESQSGSDITGLRAIECKLTWDLRFLFRTESEIHQMQSNHVCLIEAGGRASSEHTFFVGDGQSLEKVVFDYLGSKYDGQIKVIARDSITQTPLVTYEPERQKDIWVKPGDLVFILG
jgi:hypothetical protein